MTAERDLAAFVADLDLADIPVEAREHATLVVADSLGAILGGSTTPYLADLADGERAAGPATVLGRGTDRSVARAALCNGSAGSALELDEGHKYAAGHPAMHVLPAVLAEAEATGASGRGLLTAFVAGYEACARVGIACTPLDPDYHMHGVWGAAGAAAGVARLRELDPETTLATLRIGANHALHTRFEAATEGATVRNVYTGMGAMNGVLAADEAAAGITGLEDGLARHLDRLCAGGFDRDAVAAGLGERWEVTRGYFKTHAACRFTHGALDALDALAGRAALTPASVESVSVETYPTAARLDDPRPENDLQAKFSIPFAVATRILRGHSGKAAFAGDALTEEAYDLAERVDVTAADDLAARVPDARSTRVTVRLAGGRELTEEIRHAKGDEHNPFSPDELRAKFDRLAAPVIGESAADRLWALARRLPEAEPRELTAAARG